MRIAPDVDRLMWLVVESRDPSAMEEFEQRFPDLKGELARRRQIISKLKGAKRSTMHSSIPPFRPRSQASQVGLPRLAWVLGVLVLGALAFGSYSVTNYLSNRDQAAKDGGGPPQTTPPDPVGTSSQGDVGTSGGQSKLDEEPVRQDPPVREGTNGVDGGISDKPKYALPRTLKMKDTNLQAVLKALEAESGIKLEIGPGLEDAKVATVSFVQLTPLEILTLLGAEYGFTAFDQGNGSVVLIPGKPGNAAAGGATGSSTAGSNTHDSATGNLKSNGGRSPN